MDRVKLIEKLMTQNISYSAKLFLHSINSKSKLCSPSALSHIILAHPQRERQKQSEIQEIYPGSGITLDKTMNM
jgi:hypothetical protein